MTPGVVVIREAKHQLCSDPVACAFCLKFGGEGGFHSELSKERR